MIDLREEIRKTLNIASRENESDTPAFILAEYLMDCLEAFEKANNRRDKWYGVGKLGRLRESMKDD